MKIKTLLLISALCVSMNPFISGAQEIPNPKIDYAGFLESAAKVQSLRAQKRVSEKEFIKMARDPETVILDARSRQKYDMLHVKGAINLSLPDMTADELAQIIPSKDTRVLIYCNNNFENEPRAFASKKPSTSLNIHTYNVLYNYGYTNVYELGPLLDIHKTKIPLQHQEHSRQDF